MPQSPRSFPLALRLHGQDFCLLGVDIPTGWFLAGFPDDMPLTQCWQKQGARGRLDLMRQQEAWHAGLLTRGVYVLHEASWRPMTPELVQRLGGQQEELLYGYLSGLGWFRPGEEHYRECDLPAPADAVIDSPPASLERRRALTHIPGRNVLWVIKELASRSGTSAHRVWRSWYVSEFIWSWRVSLEPELTKAREKKSPTAGLTAEQALIGVGN